ncbi:MAG: tetratricopeptide repeat protein, partial [Candidatus Promineofilum sp.]|nr:tetratricopeptide repeat protein [Promineifilum sp.]
RKAARRHLEESLALAERAGATAVRVAALNNLARLRGAAGEIAAALELLELAIDLCARQGDRHREAALLNQRADWLHRAGREDEAMSNLKAAVAIYAEIGQESGGWQPEIWKLTEW